MFNEIPLQSLKEFQLDIEGAGGHKLPYSGDIEVDIIVPGITNPVSCLMLVVPDTRYAQKVPVILGTNVLELMMNTVEQEHGVRYQQTARLPDALYFAFRCMKLQAQKMKKSNGLLGIVKCALTNKVVIPSNSSMVVDGTLSRQVPDSCRLGLVQPLSKPVLPDGVTITPTLVTLDHGSLDCISVQVCNLTTGPIVIAPHSVLCQIQSCEIEMDLTSEHGSTTNFDNSILDQITLGNSILTSDQKLVVQHLVSEYSDVFSLNDLDVGFTGLVKHQIILDNAQPFKQRHRRIPPSMYSEVRNHLKQLLDTSIIRKS
jgi:dUTPase